LIEHRLRASLLMWGPKVLIASNLSGDAGSFLSVALAWGIANLHLSLDWR
jgi:hypothetical protein